jgi:hypothetical protein
MLDKVAGIGLAVALNVGPAWIRRVGPPVIAFGKEIVAAAGAARTRGGGDGARRLGEIAPRGVDDACAFDGREIKGAGLQAAPETSK